MTSCLASMAGFPADVGSTDGNVSDHDPDPAADSGVAESMEAVFEQAQRIHRRRLEMIDLSPVSDTHQLREKNGLLVEWMQDLSRQNSLLIDTVRELEKEATERCLLLETCLSRNSLCHQCCQLRDEYEIILAQREEERREHVETINSLVRDHKTLQQLVILRDRHLAALQQQHKQQLQLVTTEADSCSDADSYHGDGKQAGVSLSASSTRLLLRRCNQLIIERDRALAQLNQPSSRLISRDKLPCHISADNMSCNGSLEQLPHCHKSCSPATLAHSVSVDAPYTRTHTVHCANASVQTTVTTVTDTDNDLSSDREITATNSFIQLNNQVEEGRQLVADLQGHLATAHDQLTVKDVTLQRVEQKLLTSREQLAECRQRLQQEEDRGACQTEQCDTLEQRLAELVEQLAHAELRVQQLTADNEQQQLQLSAVHEQLAAAQTAGHQLTEANIEKDMQIGQQWTTISTLKVNVLQLKQELDAMAADPRRPSPLGLGVAPSGAAVRFKFNGVVGGSWLVWQNIVSLADACDVIARLSVCLSSLRPPLTNCSSLFRDKNEVLPRVEPLALQHSGNQFLQKFTRQLDDLIEIKLQQRHLIRCIVQCSGGMAASDDSSSCCTQYQVPQSLTAQQLLNNRLTEQLSQASAERERLSEKLREERSYRDRLQQQCDVIVDHVTCWMDVWRAERRNIHRQMATLEASVRQLQRQNQEIMTKLTSQSREMNTDGHTSSYPQSTNHHCEITPGKTPSPPIGCTFRREEGASIDHAGNTSRGDVSGQREYSVRGHHRWRDCDGGNCRRITTLASQGNEPHRHCVCDSCLQRTRRIERRDEQNSCVRENNEKSGVLEGEHLGEESLQCSRHRENLVQRQCYEVDLRQYDVDGVWSGARLYAGPDSMTGKASSDWTIRR